MDAGRIDRNSSVANGMRRRRVAAQVKIVIGDDLRGSVAVRAFAAALWGVDFIGAANTRDCNV
jgi:hypothetical protein